VAPRVGAMRGFTFIELMTSVIVAAVLLAVAVPGLAGFVRSSKVNSAQSELVSSMMLARSEASKRGLEVRMQAASGTRLADFSGGWVVWVDANGNNALDTTASSPEIIRTYPAPASGLLVRTATGVETLAFAPTGFLTQPAAVVFKVCDPSPGGKGFLVSLQPVGLTDIRAFTDIPIASRPTCT